MRKSEVSLDLILAAFLSLAAGEEPKRNKKTHHGWSRNVRPEAVPPANYGAPLYADMTGDPDMDHGDDYYELTDRVVPARSAYPR